MHSRILRGPRQWASVSPQWTALLAEVGPRSHTETAEYAHAISDELHDDGSRWFLADDDQGPLAALPYQVSVRQVGPLRVRILANARDTDGLAAPRVRPDELRDSLLAAAAADGEPIDLMSLNGLRRGGAFLRLATASATGLRSETRHGGHSVLGTRMSSDEWLVSAGRNLRSSLRKARNRFERRGALTVTTATTPRDVDAALEEYVTIEATGWKGESGALVNRPVEYAVTRHFLLAAAAQGRVEVRTLRLDGRPAAAQLAHVVDGTLELIKVAYDDALADLSPSNLLMAELIRQCCDRDDVDRIDLVTNQPWHERWHPELHPTYQARDVNLSRPGGVAVRLGSLAGLEARLPRA